MDHNLEVRQEQSASLIKHEDKNVSESSHPVCPICSAYDEEAVECRCNPQFVGTCRLIYQIMTRDQILGGIIRHTRCNIIHGPDTRAFASAMQQGRHLGCRHLGTFRCWNFHWMMQLRFRVTQRFNCLEMRHQVRVPEYYVRSLYICEKNRSRTERNFCSVGLDLPGT